MSIVVRLDLALRTYKATKATNCSLATQYQAVRALEKLLGEACDELPRYAELDRSELAHVMKLVEIEIRRSVESAEVTPS